MMDPKKQLPPTQQSLTVNERMLDAMVRHQIGLLRLSGSIRNRVFALLDATEADIEAQIRERMSGRVTLSARRLQSLKSAIQRVRFEAWKEVTELWVEEMRGLAVAEAATVDSIINTVSPVTLSTNLPTSAMLVAMVEEKPFEGRIMRDWAGSLQTADINRIQDAVTVGMVQGEGIDQITRRVIGSKAAQWRDGATQTTRRQAAAVTRTAVNHFANTAKRQYYEANADIMDGELYVATLDARTTLQCANLDGRVFPVGQGAIPPLHWNCRSVRVPLINGEVIGDRPAKPFTERQLLREFSERNGIKPPVSRRVDLPRGTKGKFDQYARTRIRELTGQIPAKVTYSQWLTRQPASFQDDVLGKARGRLFRDGKLSLDKFTNREGDEIPLSQLAKRERKAFEDAGLDPQKFL